MSEAKLRETAEKHAAAVVAGDVPTALADLDPSLHEQVPVMVAAMPTDLSRADVIALTVTTSGGTTDTRYTGSSGSIVVNATWELQDGRFIAIAAAPVE